MDKVVQEVGRKGNCVSIALGCLSFSSPRWLGTYCGVFRRQALDRGGSTLEVDHIVTGHNADDMAETVLMNGTSILLVGPWKKSFMIMV